MNKTKGKPFLEVFSSALREDYRFPLLELYVFLYVLGTFVLTSFSGSMYSYLTSSEYSAYLTVSSSLNLTLMIFTILLFKNISFGVGSDIEKGIIQTYFAYPLKRWHILTAKLLSAIGISILILMSIQLLSLFVIAPGFIGAQIGSVFLTYAASLSFPLIIAAILLLVALITKKGSTALIIGIVSYFVIYVVSGIISSLSYAFNSALPAQIISFIYPATALNYYFSPSNPIWAPTLSDVSLIICGSYVIAAVLFALSYYYFSRRLSV